MFDVKTYRPAGPTLKRFHESSAFIRLMAGPVGSGKTAGAGCAEMVLGAMIQQPMPDGVRRAKFGVLRDTYRNLYSQFIPSWFEWYPRELGSFVGSDDRPAMHTFSADTPIGPCEIQVEMRALGANSVEKTCRGWNLTGCFLDEADLLPEETIAFLTGRVKRWPQRPYRVTKGVWGVFNKPDVDHWTYQMCMEEKHDRADFEFFDQPGGLLDGGPPFLPNPAAENLERLDDDYYLIQATNNKAAYVRRMVRNKWGSSVAGDPVYPEFNTEHHVSTIELEPGPRDRLTVGLDGGGTPAATISGRDPVGRRITYAELVMVDPFDPKRRRLVHGVGPTRFGQALKELLKRRFPNNPVTIYGDPAAFYGADREGGEFSYMETVGHAIGVAVQPAPSNEIYVRHEAVRDGLTNWRDGRPMQMINPSCLWIRAGATSDYKYEPADPKQPGKTLKPLKTRTSHVHDAWQYDALGDVGRAGVVAGEKFDRWSPAAQQEAAGSPIWRQIAESERANTGPGHADSYGDAGGPAYSTEFNLWRS